MKKKGLNYSLKILSMFLAVLAITLYLSNNVVIISALESPDDTDYVENETEIDYPEESESELVSESNMEIFGGMIEIPPHDGDVAEIQGNDQFSHYIPNDDGGGAYSIEDGVYAFENVGNSGLWMDIQQDKYLPGYHMQQYAASGNPAQTFDRSCLFKITRRASTNTYIINIRI